MLKYMYIDESGDLGERGSKFLILSALLVDNPASLDRIIKNMRRHKFKKELQGSHEIKANKSSEEIVKHMLLKLNEVKDAKIFYIALEKRKLTSKYLKTHKHKLYNFVAGKLARHSIFNNIDVEIRIDRSKGKQLLQEDFNEYFSKTLAFRVNNCRFSIQHSYSQSWSGLQFSDILAWALFQKFEHNNNEYIDLVTVEKDIFYMFSFDKRSST